MSSTRWPQNLSTKNVLTAPYNPSWTPYARTSKTYRHNIPNHNNNINNPDTQIKTHSSNSTLHSRWQVYMVEGSISQWNIWIVHLCRSSSNNSRRVSRRHWSYWMRWWAKDCRIRDSDINFKFVYFNTQSLWHYLSDLLRCHLPLLQPPHSYIPSRPSCQHISPIGAYFHTFSLFMCSEHLAPVLLVDCINRDDLVISLQDNKEWCIRCLWDLQW